ncbi:cation transporter [Paracoccus sp. 11-3]|uniref:Cation transporter n=1 Tax=Paracoccus amoyensis TaxID=2760093 RepID=A0A926GGU7_9RHOB|nr:cation transporter [Paracoccus amoyensis]MBC9247034.1 cation transporter [Paracoccus amoyensis]
MGAQDIPTTQQLESRSLGIAMAGNLVMAVAGVVAGFMTNSNAIIMDGLFSMTGFASAFLARGISRKIEAGPDRLRPYGYAADEAIFVTFRSLSLLGLVLFAITSAARNIFSYLHGNTPEPLNFAPMTVYFVLITAICFWLWWSHWQSWIKSGKSSDILLVESRAAAFDGAITLATGIGMLGIYLLRDGPLAPIAPVGDSIIVIILCLTAIGQYISGLRSGLGELAGVTAAPDIVARAHRAVRPALIQDGGRLTDLSVTKSGRSYYVSVYYDPLRPMAAAEVDTLNLQLIYDMRAALPGSDVLLVISTYPRRWPDAVNPFKTQPDNPSIKEA